MSISTIFVVILDLKSYFHSAHQIGEMQGGSPQPEYPRLEVTGKRFHQENSSCVEGLVHLTHLTGVANFPVRNISLPFFLHKSQVVRSLSVFYGRHILSELNNRTSELCISTT